MCRNVDALRHIILIPSQPVTALTPYCYELSVVVTNYYFQFIVYVLTGPGLEPMIYRTRGEHATHYTTDVVHYRLVSLS